MIIISKQSIFPYLHSSVTASHYRSFPHMADANRHWHKNDNKFEITLIICVIWHCYCWDASERKLFSVIFKQYAHSTVVEWTIKTHYLLHAIKRLVVYDIDVTLKCSILMQSGLARHSRWFVILDVVDCTRYVHRTSNTILNTCCTLVYGASCRTSAVEISILCIVALWAM